MRSLVVGLVLIGLLGGCAPVRPWQREPLARRVMQPVLDSQERALMRVRDKSQYAGGTSGGATHGAGCGCN